MKNKLKNGGLATIISRPLSRVLASACLLAAFTQGCDGCKTNSRTPVTMQYKSTEVKGKSKIDVTRQEKEKLVLPASRKALAKLSEVSVYSIGKTEKTQLESAEKEISAAGLEFRKLLLENPSSDAAKSYLDLMHEITVFEMNLKENFRSSHNVDLVNQVIYYASARGRNPDNLRLGCLLLILHEIPAIRHSVPKNKTDPQDDSIYSRITLSSFLTVFMENDLRFKSIGNLVLMWAEESKTPLKKEELTTLFEGFRDNLQ